MMSNDGLIIENMDLSHIHLAVLIAFMGFSAFLNNRPKNSTLRNPLTKQLWAHTAIIWTDFIYTNVKDKGCQYNTLHLLSNLIPARFDVINLLINVKMTW